VPVKWSPSWWTDRVEDEPSRPWPVLHGGSWLLSLLHPRARLPQPRQRPAWLSLPSSSS
jgi:hypothetical protein